MPPTAFSIATVRLFLEDLWEDSHASPKRVLQEKKYLRSILQPVDLKAPYLPVRTRRQAPIGAQISTLPATQGAVD